MPNPPNAIRNTHDARRTTRSIQRISGPAEVIDRRDGRDAIRFVLEGQGACFFPGHKTAWRFTVRLLFSWGPGTRPIVRDICAPDLAEAWRRLGVYFGDGVVTAVEVWDVERLADGLWLGVDYARDGEMTLFAAPPHRTHRTDRTNNESAIHNPQSAITPVCHGH